MADEETPFTLATVADYVAIYGDPDASLAPLLEGQLARASRIVRDELAADGYDVEAMIAAGTLRADTVADVVVDMVGFAAQTSGSAGMGGIVGATQTSMTAGPYSQSATFATPVGSLSFTKVHRRRLGLAGRKAFEVDLLAGRDRTVASPWGEWLT